VNILANIESPKALRLAAEIANGEPARGGTAGPDGAI